MPKPAPTLDAVTLWIVANGIAHIMKSGEPLTALCRRDQWRKAAVVALDKPARVCADCRWMFNNSPTSRPRLRDVQPMVERQLAFAADWARLKEDP